MQRFDATSYVALLAAMDAHDVGRGRGGIAAALAPLGDRLTGVGIPGELLYPAESVKEWTSAAGAAYVDLPSIHGHDAFLLETTRVSVIIRDAIVRATAVQPTSAETKTTNTRTAHGVPSLRVVSRGDARAGTTTSEPTRDRKSTRLNSSHG